VILKCWNWWKSIALIAKRTLPFVLYKVR
jgi:hypothetical protein